MTGTLAARGGLLARLVPALALALLAGVLWSAAPAAAADATQAEVDLARTYAPIVKLKEQGESCAAGEPYEPIDVDLLMGNPEVALRGPWDDTNIVRVGPTADQLSLGLPGYHLDFPGDALRPGCTYEEFSKRLVTQAPSTAYARVVTQADAPGRLALQYWFFYVFNDWNNNHEGDWEMIQLNFDAGTPEQALARGPTEVGYSQHSSAERAEWGGSKLQVVDGTHPVVYPAEGSHANFFDSQIYLMRSESEGVGCDDARGPSRTLTPDVATVPTARSDYIRSFPWLGFDGRWGERHAGVFNGPTGPNDKLQWTEPFTWAQDSWRDTSFAVPASGAVGTSATDIFCGAVAAGSEVLRRVKANPGASVLVIGGLAVLLLWGLSRTRWEPSSPLRIARVRRWGQILSASWRMMIRHPRLFMGIGLLFVPIGILIAALQWLLFHLTSLSALVDEAGRRNAFVATLAFSIGLVLTLLGFALVQAATARALADIDAGRQVTALSAYRAVLPDVRRLVVALAVAVGIALVLNLVIVLIPVAIFLIVRWSLLGIVVGIEHDPAPGALRRSAELARGRWWRVAGITLVAVLALFVGPAIGVIFLILTGAAFDLVNLVSALVYVVSLPAAAVVQTYLYYDLRGRRESEPVVVDGPGTEPLAGTG
jgi:hypothetical protein